MSNKVDAIQWTIPTIAMHHGSEGSLSDDQASDILRSGDVLRTLRAEPIFLAHAENRLCGIRVLLRPRVWTKQPV